MRTLRAVLPLSLLMLVAGCGPSSAGEAGTYEYFGPFSAGNVRFALTDTSGRVLLTEAWYPAAESEDAEAAIGFPIEDFVPQGPDRSTFLALLATAPDPGVRRQARSKFDALPSAETSLPVVVYSHCYECTRFSSFTIAEHLATWGFVVIAPDHATNTLFDGTAAIDDAFLQTRGRDIALVLDSALAPAAAWIPEVIRGKLDPARVGVIGHSFGGATVGRVLQEDPRVVSGLAMGAPIANPLFPSVSVGAIDDPVAFILLEEDGSIGPTGNSFIEQNFEQVAPPAWLFSIEDAGHWSVSDLCGIVDGFEDGCGGDGSDDWQDIVSVRAGAAAWAAAFFDHTLNGNPDAAGELVDGLGLGSIEERTE